MTSPEPSPPGSVPAGGLPAAGRHPTPTAIVLPRALTLLLGSAAAVVVAAGAHALAWLIGPAFLALVIVIVVSPVQDRLRRLGLPGWVATLVMLVLVYAVLLVLAGVLVVSIARLATVLPTYADKANSLVSSGAEVLSRFGVGAEQLRNVAGTLSLSRVVGLIAALLLGLTGLAGNLIFLLSLLLFMVLEASASGARIEMIAHDRPVIAEALGRFASGTRRFLLVTTVFGLLIGALDAVVLWALGVPLAILWGLLAFIANYVPYVGFFIGLVPPALLALLGGGWQLMLIVIAIYIVLNFVVTSLIQPYFVGDSVGISITATVLALVFWGWLLGPLGAVMAIPLTLLAKVLLVDVDPRARWAHALLGSARSTTRPDPPTTPAPTAAPAAAAPAAAAPAATVPAATVPAATTDDVIAQLTMLGRLRTAGVLTEDEFAVQKARVLGT